MSGEVPVWFLTIVIAAALAAIDMKKGILPDKLVLPLLLCGAVLLFFRSRFMPDVPSAIFGATLGVGCFTLVRLVVGRLKGVEAMGLGDVKLMAPLGLFMGLDIGPGILFACVAQLLVFLSCRRRGEMPFGPALIAGAAAMVIYRAIQSGLPLPLI